MIDERLNKLMKELSEGLFGKPVKQTRSSTRNSRQKTGRYWVYGYKNDDPIAKVCQTCRSNESLMTEHYGKVVDEIYFADRRNKNKCDVCGGI
jgi:hypothetical protein